MRFLPLLAHDGWYAVGFVIALVVGWQIGNLLRRR
jgi:hypothetical protein